MTKLNKTSVEKNTFSQSSQVKPLEMTAHEQVASEPLNVLITRPKAKAQELAQLLNEQGISTTSQALFEYQSLANKKTTEQALQAADLIIFVSVAAVNFSHNTSPLINNLPETVFAVGQATKQALVDLGIKNIISPAVGQEHSEGLLKLPQLSNIKDKSVVIVRGNGGREHLASNLSQRGAKVSYLESYQRVWLSLANNCAEQWRAQQINCIVITSNDILLTLYKHLQRTAKITGVIDAYWQSQCLWLVVSERLEKNAKQLGLARVINARGASSKILCDTLKALA